MFTLAAKRPGRVRIACAHTGRDLVVINYTIDTRLPQPAIAEEYRQNLSFAWQCVPDAMVEASTFHFHWEEADGPTVKGIVPSFAPLYAREHLGGHELVHCILRLHRKLARRAWPTLAPVTVKTEEQRALDTLASMLAGSANHA